MATQTGTDFIDTLTASLLDGEDLNGLAGNDMLVGDAAQNIMNGGAGNDYLSGGADVDWLFGGDGSSNVTGTDVMEGGVGADLILGGEANFFDITIAVASYNVLLTALKNNDFFGAALAGIDFANKLSIAAASYVDNEFDLTSYVNSPDGVTVHLNDHQIGNTWVGSATSPSDLPVTIFDPAETLLGIEGVIGSNHDDHLTGPYDSQNMTPLDGSKWIIPFEIPKASEDENTYNIQYYIHAAEGNDIINGVLAPVEPILFDQIVDLDPPTPTYVLDPHVTNAYGLLRGGAGTDIIFGGNGNDLIYGGIGDDTIDGGGGFNTMCFDTSPAAVDVDLNLLGSPDDTGIEAAGTDTLKNIQGLSGSNFDDTLTGDGNNNLLIGLLGNDTLRGDPLIGGVGKDTFVFNLSVNDGDDTIMDMNFDGTQDILKFTSINHTIDSVSEIDAMIASGGITGDATHTLVTFMNGASIDFKGLAVDGFATDDGHAHSIADFGIIQTGDLYFTQLPPDYKPFDVQSAVPPLVV